jgi:two-component system nitrate/nitrite response regulator NarL
MRVQILADIRLYREGLADLLARRGIDVMDTTAEAAGVSDARTPRPDVVLVDMAMPDAIPTLRRLAAVFPDVSAVALGLPETEANVLACAEAGVAGYVPTEGSAEELVDTLGHVVRGEALCSPNVVGSLFRRVANLAVDRRPAATAGRLTARERQIMELVDRGLTNREIADRLGIELSTVKNHVHNTLDKLQVRRRGQAAALALEGTGAWR